MKNTKNRKTTNQLLLRLQKVECPDTTYFSSNFPIVMKRGSGMWVHDVDNKRYLDFNACFGVLALGHRPKVTLQTLRKQSAKLIHGMGDVHPTLPKIKLLELLASISPYQNAKSLLSLSGGDAIETAIKTSMLATKRSQFLCFSGGYHGLQFAPLSLNHRKEFTSGFESWLQNKSVSLPFPYFPPDSISNDNNLSSEFLIKNHQLYTPEHVIQTLEDELKKRKFAALILEPFQSRGGKRGFSPNFLQECQNLCKKYGTLLIFDEIYTGFGRTGKMFAYEHYDVIPDLLCVGKAMGGGLPISACIGDIMEVWEKSKGEAKHTQTFLGHPLACAVAYETIKQIKNNLSHFQNELQFIEMEFSKFTENMKQKGLFKKFPFEIRGKGFMRGLWFYTQNEGFCISLMENLLDNGIIVLPEGNKTDVISITPPLIATSKHFKIILNKIMTQLENIKV